jgi:hypothetical protein
MDKRQGAESAVPDDNAFARALRREMDLFDIQIRTIGTYAFPYPTLPLFSTAEEQAAVRAEYERLVREYDERHPDGLERSE